jgi:predicted ATPase
MMRSLCAENFKSWRNTGPIRLAPLTGLFGANSSGKTSILQVLLMLKQTVESPDRKRVLHTGDENSIVDLGTFFDLIHGHQTQSHLKLSFEWNLPEKLVINDPEKGSEKLFAVDALSFTTDIRLENSRVVVNAFQYEFDNHVFGMRRLQADKDRYELISNGYEPKRVQGRPWPLPPPAKFYGFPDEATGFYQNLGFLPDFDLALEKLFSRITYLAPLRDDPQRTYLWGGERPPDVGVYGGQAVAALLAARAAGLTSSRMVKKKKRHRPIEERILEWMRSMNLVHSFSLEPIAPNRKDYEVRIKTTAASPEVLVTDVGFGVSQILPVLVLCYYAPAHSTIILEQPEIHLHPSVQAGLADVIIDSVVNRQVQIVVESHSEHLLRRLQRRIAEEKISADATALYFCEMDQGESKISELKVDEFGNISNWPKGFFGDEMAELAAMTRASIKRQMVRQS